MAETRVRGSGPRFTLLFSSAQQLTYDMVTKGASNVSMENLQGVIDWYQQNK